MTIPLMCQNRSVEKSFIFDRTVWGKKTKQKKTPLKKKMTQNVNMNVQWTWFPNL